jgi:lysine 2,3-aminomutase
VVVIPNWTNEFARSYKNIKDLYSFLDWPLTPELESVAQKYPLFIPRRLAEKIKKEGPLGVLAQEFLPAINEIDLKLNQNGLVDPIGDKAFFRAPQLIHRYPSRALFTPTTICPVHCRYCFRKNELSADEEMFQNDFKKTLAYLESHDEISEIIFTGGDPFTLSNEKLDTFLSAFSQIKSIKDVRFHTRYPVIFPERIDDGLLSVLKNASNKFRTVSIAIHSNHINEFDEFNRLAISNLSSLRIQLLSQTVLLKGINDEQSSLIKLFEHFIDLKIRPYYLHHPDRVRGGMHFYISLEKGRQLYQLIRKVLPGWAIPHYVIDIPEGHGKVSAFNPETIEFSGKLISLHGDLIEVTEPDFFS